MVAQWMSVFLRRCDVLDIACLAQIVNTISPLLTTNDQLLRQTTFYPFVLFSNHAAGQSLEPLTSAPESDTKLFGPMPLLDVSASYDQANDRGAVFIVNRSQHEAVTTDIGWQGAAPAQVAAAYQLCRQRSQSRQHLRAAQPDCAEAAGWAADRRWAHYIAPAAAVVHRHHDSRV